MSDNTETFIIKVRKSKNEDTKAIDSASLIKSLLERHSFFSVEEVLEAGKKNKH